MLTATGDLADSLVESDGSGNITANVTGNVTGNLTGNVTGDLTGNVTSTGVNSLHTLTVTNSLTIPNDSIDAGTKIDWTIGSSGTQSVGTSGWVVPEGLVNIVHTGGGGSPVLEIFVSSAWRTASDFFRGGAVWSDGTNMRLITSASTATVYYQVLT